MNSTGSIIILTQWQRTRLCYLARTVYIEERQQKQELSFDLCCVNSRSEEQTVIGRFIAIKWRIIRPPIVLLLQRLLRRKPTNLPASSTDWAQKIIFSFEGKQYWQTLQKSILWSLNDTHPKRQIVSSRDIPKYDFMGVRYVILPDHIPSTRGMKSTCLSS
jgi:hypothetical protein